MRGYWTCNPNCLNAEELNRFIKGGGIIGDVVPGIAFGAFDERCRELDFFPPQFLHYPEEARTEFYAGKVVWILLSKTHASALVDMGKAIAKIKESKKKPPTP